VPSWADDPKIGYKLINARSEEAATKPPFRSAMKKRRSLIPADGYYEQRFLDRTTRVTPSAASEPTDVHDLRRSLTALGSKRDD